MGERKVLLVNDVKHALELEKTFFRREGFILLVARSGREALEMIAEHRPDLAMLTLEMADLPGDECCRRLKQDPALSSVPVVMIAPESDPAAGERCRRAGCDRLLNQPFDSEQVLETARDFLDIAGRIAPRVPARLRVHVGAGEQRLLTEYSLNVSTGGLFLETDDPFPEDTPLSLEFFLPTREQPIRCRARVAWTNDPGRKKKPDFPGGMGVQFIDLRLDDLHAVRDFIRQETLSPSW